MSSAVTDSPARGSYDYARRRRTKRAGREKGCWLYIPQEELEKAGLAIEQLTEAGHDPLPWYRVWGSRRGIAIRLYKAG